MIGIEFQNSSTFSLESGLFFVIEESGMLTENYQSQKVNVIPMTSLHSGHFDLSIAPPHSPMQ